MNAVHVSKSSNTKWKRQKLLILRNEEKSWLKLLLEQSHHYLIELGPNTKKIPQNSGKQIQIPEGM